MFLYIRVISATSNLPRMREKSIMWLPFKRDGRWSNICDYRNLSIIPKLLLTSSVEHRSFRELRRVTIIGANLRKFEGIQYLVFFFLSHLTGGLSSAGTAI